MMFIQPCEPQLFLSKHSKKAPCLNFGYPTFLGTHLYSCIATIPGIYLEFEIQN